jgi:hypothetical protein
VSEVTICRALPAVSLRHIGRSSDLGWNIAQPDRLKAHWRLANNPGLTVPRSSAVKDVAATRAWVLGQDDPSHRPAQMRQPVSARKRGRWRPSEHKFPSLIAEPDQAGALAAWRVAPKSTRSHHLDRF